MKMNVLVKDQIVLELLNEEHYYTIKIQINNSNSNNNNNLKDIINQIVSLILSQQELLNQNQDSQNSFLYSPTTNHKIFNPMVEILELVYLNFKNNSDGWSNFNSSNNSSDGTEFHGSWHIQKESIIKLLLKNASSVRVISNIIKSLNIIIDNNNFTSIINHKDIINNNNIINQIEYLVQQFKLDIEMMVQDNSTLLDLASTYNNIKLFIKLVDLGAGRKANPIVVNTFYQQLSDEEKVLLKPSLSKLFIINPKINWEISINQLFPLAVDSNISTVDPKQLLLEASTSTKRIIPIELWNIIRSIVLNSNEDGTRSVILIDDEFGNGIYLKFKPQYPVIELAVHDLCKQIFPDDTLTPHCELASINQIPVLLSQQIPGEPLIDILERDQDILNQIEPSNISKQLVMAMLTNNNFKSSLSDFILVPHNNDSINYKYHLLYSIDNEQILKSNGILQGESLQVDTVLLLFNQMNNIVDQDVIYRIKNLDIYGLLKSWLSNLKHHHQLLLYHFKSNREQLKKYKEAIVGVSFGNNMIEHLYSKLQRLKQLFNKDSKSKSITHLQILESIEPLVYNRYKQVINNHPGSSIIMKYKQLVTCSTNPSSHIVGPRSIPNAIDIQDQLWGANFDLSQALGQLNKLNYHLDTIENQFRNLKQLIVKLKESNSKKQDIVISNYDLQCLINADFNTITEYDQQVLCNYIKSKGIPVINFKNNNQLLKN